MKYLMILLVLVLAGCEDGITGDVVQEIDINEWDSLKSQCPECEECEACPKCVDKECPECPRCEKCEECEKCEKCEKCETYDGEVQIDLDEVSLYKLTKTSDEQTIEIEYSKELYDDLEKVELSFRPSCDEDEELSISANQYELYDREPKCNQENILTIRSNRLNAGTNKIKFTSEHQMRLRDVELKSEYKDDTYVVKGFNDVRIDSPDKDNKKLKDLDDIQLKNSVEHKFKLTDDESEEDMFLRFDATEVEGRLTVEINNKVIYDKEPSEGNLRINIDAKYLKDGTNTLEFIGVN